jgi:Leucine rich repeat
MAMLMLLQQILPCIILASVSFWYPATMTTASVVANAVATSRRSNRFLEENENIFVSHFSSNGTVRQLHALYCFYMSTGMNATDDGDDSVGNNWFRDDPEMVACETDVEMSYYCNFTGVGCDKQGHVTSLKLSDSGLTGYIPDCLADLDQLRSLILKGNRLTGPIPSSLAQLVHLSTLNLAANSFSGLFPADIWSDLTSLRRLRLDRNLFEGTIPDSFCQLSALVALDLAANARLSGSLPLCLANLAHLESLRITDIGLTGTIPPGLCSSDRAMNGFSPNTLGCSVIGCPPGTFHYRNGRITSSDAECTPCEVPSNVIASTQCIWVNDIIVDQEDDSRQPSWAPIFVDQDEDSGQPSWAPTSVDQEGDPRQPSWAPLVDQDEDSRQPSWAPTLVDQEDDSRQPSWAPTLVDQEDDSRQPRWAPTLLPLLYSPTKSSVRLGPTPAPMVTAWGKPSPLPTYPPSINPNDDDSLVEEGIVVGSDVDSTNATPGILGGVVTAGAFLIILMAFLVWRRRARYKELTDPLHSADKESQSSDPEMVDIPSLSHQSLSTIEEENNSEAVVVGSGSTASIPKSPTVSSDPPSPPDLMRQVGTGTGRRVRFSLPDPIPHWSSGDSEDRGAKNGPAQRPQQEHGHQHEQVAYDMNSIPRQQDSDRASDAEAWASWILYPLFDTPGLCAMPTRALRACHEDDDQDLGSAPSHYSATTPVLRQPWSTHLRESSDSSTTDFYYCFDSSPHQPQSMNMTGSSLRRSGLLLGIEDRIIDSEDDGITLLERGYGGFSTTTTTAAWRSTLPSRVPTKLEQSEGDSSPSGDFDLVSTMAVIDEGTYHHVEDDDDDWAAAIGDMAEI